MPSLAILTGGCSRFGFQLARKLCADYQSRSLDNLVVLSSRDKAKGQDAVQRLSTEFGAGCAQSLFLDVTQAESVKQFASEIRANYGYVDLMINCVELVSDDWEFPPYEADLVKLLFETNVIGLKRCIESIAPLLKPHAKIIHLVPSYSLVMWKEMSPSVRERLTRPDLSIHDVGRIVEEVSLLLQKNTAHTEGWSASLYPLSKLLSMVLVRVIGDARLRAVPDSDIFILSACLNDCTGSSEEDQAARRETAALEILKLVNRRMLPNEQGRFYLGEEMMALDADETEYRQLETHFELRRTRLTQHAARLRSKEPIEDLGADTFRPDPTSAAALGTTNEQAAKDEDGSKMGEEAAQDKQPVKEEESLEEEGAARNGQPVQDEGAARNGQPLQDEGAARNGQPVQDEGAARNGQPVQDEGASRNGQPVQDEGASRNGQPVQDEGASRNGQPVQDEGASRNGQPVQDDHEGALGSAPDNKDASKTATNLEEGEAGASTLVVDTAALTATEVMTHETTVTTTTKLETTSSQEVRAGGETGISNEEAETGNLLEVTASPAEETREASDAERRPSAAKGVVRNCSVVCVSAPETPSPRKRLALATCQTENMDLGADLPKDAVLLKAVYLSLDQSIRDRLFVANSRAYKIGETITGHAVGEIIKSNNEKYCPGDYLVATLPWCEYAVYTPSAKDDAKRIPSSYHLPLTRSVGLLGMASWTAWLSLKHICEPVAGETLLVLDASSAIGQVLGQLAALKGLRVVGMASSEEEAEYLVKELRFENAFKASDPLEDSCEALVTKLQSVCPNGIDCAFGNVGGFVLDAVLAVCNRRARISLHELPTTDNGEDGGDSYRLKNLEAALAREARIEGISIASLTEKYGVKEAITEMTDLLADGKLKYKHEIVTSHLSDIPDLLTQVFGGDDVGERIVNIEQQ